MLKNAVMWPVHRASMRGRWVLRRERVGAPKDNVDVPERFLFQQTLKLRVEVESRGIIWANPELAISYCLLIFMHITYSEV